LLHATVMQGSDDENDPIPHDVSILIEPHLLPGKEPTTMSLRLRPPGASPYVEFSTAPETLGAVAAQLQEAAVGWRDTLLAVAQRRRAAKTDADPD
jgi:hypothetical protein